MMKLVRFLNSDDGMLLSNVDPQKEMNLKSILKKVVEDYTEKRNDNPKFAIQQNLPIQYINDFKQCEDFSKYFQQQGDDDSSSKEMQFLIKKDQEFVFLQGKFKRFDDRWFLNGQNIIFIKINEAFVDENSMEEYAIKILLTNFKKNLISGGVDKVIEFSNIVKDPIDQIDLMDFGYSEQMLKRTQDPAKLEMIHQLKNPLLQIDIMLPSPPETDLARLKFYRQNLQSTVYFYNNAYNGFDDIKEFYDQDYHSSSYSYELISTNEITWEEMELQHRLPEQLNKLKGEFYYQLQFPKFTALFEGLGPSMTITQSNIESRGFVQKDQKEAVLMCYTGFQRKFLD